jgi:ceramide glucosyltransferase
MTIALWAAATFCGLALAVHLGSIAIVRCRTLPANSHRRQRRHGPSSGRPAGRQLSVDAASTFALNYPNYEILFCVASASDPVVALIRGLMNEHPTVRARLLIGDERISANPKLNNVLKGWRAAAHDRIVMTDSNVLLPRDYIQRLLASWQHDTGLVSAPPVGSHPQGFWAQIECTFLNTYQARWQYTADTLGLGFAQGKTLFYRRSDIEAAGGLRALAAEAAEDAASTKIVRESGRRVRLVDAPFQQPLGTRGRRDVWDRQVRWARLRRDSFALFYCLEVTSGAALPLVAVAFLAAATGYSVLAAGAAFVALWYGAEMLLAATAVGISPCSIRCMRCCVTPCCRFCGSKAGAPAGSSGAAGR